MNPIPFNPQDMTARQLLEVAEVMSTLFQMQERGRTPDDIARVLSGARDSFEREWSK